MKKIALILIVFAIFTSGCKVIPTGETVSFDIDVGISFESEEVNIEGYTGGAVFEPIGYAIVHIEAEFPADGGSVINQTGTVTLTSYEGKGPYCTLQVNDDLIQKEIEGVLFDDLVLDPVDQTITLLSPVEYENIPINITVNCSGQSYTSDDYPFTKTVGAFNEGGIDAIAVPYDLTETTSMVYDGIIHDQSYFVLRSNLDIVVTPK